MHRQRFLSGGELFKNYGDDWFTSREEKLGLVPLGEDYQKANTLLESLRQLEDRLELSHAVRQDLYSILKAPFWASRSLNVLPRDYDLFAQAVQDSLETLQQEYTTRSLDDLRMNGRCLDNIEPKESSLPFAGRGAFATRDLPHGSIVTGSPLMHVPFDDLAKMWDTMDDVDFPGYFVRNKSKFVGFHLWYNYCFGHSNSTLLLCPYGSGVNYINHNQTLANIKVQWAPQGIVAQDDAWLKRSPAEMENVSSIFLGIDYVATRDIRKGEELFMDYGDGFEQAWQEHVANWHPTDKDFEYVSATFWNREHANEKILTAVEQRSDPYPENLLLRCHPNTWNDGEYRSFEWSIEDYYDRDVLWPSYEKGNYCNVYDRIVENGDTVYTVEVWDEYEYESRVREDVPREMLSMIDKPYSTDWHKQGVFRHYIGIPDGMMPDEWRNVVTDG